MGSSLGCLGLLQLAPAPKSCFGVCRDSSNRIHYRSILVTMPFLAEMTKKLNFMTDRLKDQPAIDRAKQPTNQQTVMRVLSA